MIGTLILAFVGLMAIASLILFALIRVGVIDQPISLFLFVAAVPLAAWIALGLETVELGGASFPPQDEMSHLVHVDIEQLWPISFNDTERSGRHWLRGPIHRDDPVPEAIPQQAGGKERAL